MPRTQQNRSFKSSSLTPIVKPQAIVPSGTLQPSAPGFGQLIKEGIGFGAGQAIAHRAVNAVLGPTTTTVVQTASESKLCNLERETFERCLKTQQGDTCNNELTAYKQCIEFK